MNQILRFTSSLVLSGACVIATAGLKAEAQSSDPPVTAAEPGANTPRTQAQRASDVINVEDFGAVPDFNRIGYCQYYTTAGSNVLKTTCMQFSTSMLAPSGSPPKVLIVPGAGANGATLVTTLTGVTDPTDLTMGDNAQTTSMSNGTPSVPEYGTDNTKAINNAVAAAKMQLFNQQDQDGTNYVAADLYFPGGAGAYGVTSVNMTGITNAGFRVSGSGTIWGFGLGLPVVDMLNSDYVKWDGVNIIGDYNSIPSAGMQIGRINDQNHNSSDNSAISNMLISGAFSTAALLNEQSETTQWIADRFYNHNPNSSATNPTYAVAWDGVHHLPVNSNYQNDQEPQNEGNSFGENICVGCIFAGWIPQFIGGTNKLREVSSYETADGGYGVELYSIPGDDNLNTKLDLHIENSNPLIADFLVSGGPGSQPNFTGTPVPYLPGFEFIENGSVATVAIFKVDPNSGITHVNMATPHIEIDDATYGNPNATTLFADPADWFVDGGEIMGPNSGFMNLAAANFQGTYTNGATGSMLAGEITPTSVQTALADNSNATSAGWSFNQTIFSNQNLQLGSGKALNLYNHSFNGGAPCYLDMGSNGQITCADGQVESWLLGATTAKSLTVAQGTKVNLDVSGNLALEEDTGGNAVILTGSGTRLLSIDPVHGNVVVKGSVTTGNP